MRVLTVIALAGFLTGCVADGTVTTPAATDGPVPWGFGECRFVIAIASVPEDRLRAVLPEGFEPSPGQVAPFVPVREPYLAVEAFRCATATGPGGAIADAAYGSVFTAAVPPPHLARADAEMHFVKWDTLVAHAVLRERLAAAGLPVRDGDASVPDATPSSGESVTAALAMDGFGTATFEGVVATRFASGDASPFAEYSPTTSGGIARWEAVVHPDGPVAEGHGVLRFPPGSWAADVAGSESVPARFIAGWWSFTDGRVVLDAATASAGVK